MSRRFPITAAGDPHASPALQLFVHSVISLLTLPSSTVPPLSAPLEHLNLSTAYASYLQATHVTPLQVLQALLPLLRAAPARARDALANGLGKHSIVVCLPATDARVGLPFAAAQAMSAAATLRAVEVLRREIRASAATAHESEAAAAMRNIKVVVVDVGAVGPAAGVGEGDAAAALQATEEWTPAERAAYGLAFGALVEQGGAQRRPSDVATFVRAVVDVVGGGRRAGSETACMRLEYGLGRVRELVFGERVVVGAGGESIHYNP